MIKVGITGGIGSGKSTVCRLFAACGVPVYDSDSQAKRLMEEDGPLRMRLAARFGEEVYAGGRLNRKLLAGRVFSDPAELSALNETLILTILMTLKLSAVMKLLKSEY